MNIAIIAITRNGAHLGTKLRNGLAAGTLFVQQKHAGQAGKGATTFTCELKELIPPLWQEYDGFIMIMATGIVVRMVAPLLEGKAQDPAVVVMDDAGKFAISLLSGHLGGANDLAERAAFITGARAVITTATDANGLPSFDLLARDHGWVIEELSRVKILNSLLLENEEIAVVDTTGLVRNYFHGRGRLVYHNTFIAAQRSSARGILFVTNSFIPPQFHSERLLVLRPRNLVLGIGCNSNTTASEIQEVIQANLKRLLLSPASIALLATAEAKRDEPGLLACAESLGVPLRCFASEELNRVATPSPPSEHALAAIGAAGVAEPAALLGSGGGHLLLKKVKSGNVTLAIAEFIQGEA
jgi:cobalt-precorrin 5A hydrolase